MPNVEAPKGSIIDRLFKKRDVPPWTPFGEPKFHAPEGTPAHREPAKPAKTITAADAESTRIIKERLEKDPGFARVLGGRKVEEIQGPVADVIARIAVVPETVSQEVKLQQYQEVDRQLRAMAEDSSLSDEVKRSAREAVTSLERQAVVREDAVPHEPSITEEHDWLLRDRAGNTLNAGALTDEQGNVIRERPHLEETVRRISDNLGTRQMRSDDVERAYQQLDYLMNQYPDEVTPTDVEPFKARLREAIREQMGTRWEPTSQDIHDIKFDVVRRDEIFYDLLKSLLEDPDQTSRDTMNLYKEAALDLFTDHLREAPNGDRLVREYNSLKHAIVAFHDLDYYARHAAGDIKSYKTAITYFQNAFAIQAISDPMVENLTQCYEQALQMISENNDGYIPSALVSYDSQRHENYWDSLALDLMKKRVESGLVQTVRQDATGLAIPETDVNVLQLNGLVNAKDIDDRNLRVLAAMRMAKGLGLLNGRFLEIFAFSKTPGYDNPEFGTGAGGPGFSSKAYEGIARWFNPMSDFFGKFKMGNIEHMGFFMMMVGNRDNDITTMQMMKDVVQWSPNEQSQAAAHLKDGTFNNWLKWKYGDKYKGVLRNDIVDFAFSGAFGPLSSWRTMDSTVGWSDKDRERLGGALRLFTAGRWAGARAGGHGEGDRAGGVFSRLLGSDAAEHRREGQRVRKLEEAYKAYIWAQTAVRNPLTIARALRVQGTEYYVDKHHFLPRKLRNIVIQEILGNEFDVENYVAKERTPTIRHIELYKRIELLEGDVATVQQAAMTGGPDGAPRDIGESDFEHIKGSATWTRDGSVFTVTEAERRAQARDYVRKVQERALGSWGVAGWMDRLGFSMGADGKLAFNDNYKNLDGIFAGAKENGALLTLEEINAPIPQHMSTTDVQWRYLDLQTLGERHWARRANDLEARSNTINEISSYLNMIGPHPDTKELSKQLNKIYLAESAHDPAEGRKFVYLLGEATGMFYRRSILAEFPVLGKMFEKSTGQSVSKLIHGAEHGTAWSINNEREWANAVITAGHLPHHQHDQYGNVYPYTGGMLEKRLIATPGWAIAETVLIGGFLLAAAVAALGLTAGSKDQGSTGGHR